MQEKKEKIIGWLVFIFLQVSSFALLYFWGQGLKYIAIFLAFISLGALVFASPIKLTKILTIAVIIADVLLFIGILSLFSGILVVDNQEKTKTIWTKKDYYISEADSFHIMKDKFYIHNKTQHRLKIEGFHYGNDYPQLPFGSDNVIKVIEPHSLEEVGHKPDYIFTQPPSRILTKKKNEYRTVLRYY